MQHHPLRFVIESWSGITAIFAALAACVSFGISLYTVRFNLSNRRRDQIKNTMAYLDEWRKPDFTADRDFITISVKDRLTQSFVEGGYSGLKGVDRRRIRNVSHYLEYLGTMMKNGYVDEDLVLEQIGESVEKLWRILGPLVQQERRNRAKGVDLIELPNQGRDHPSQRYQHGFEHIAARSQNFHLKKRHRMEKYKGDLEPLVTSLKEGLPLTTDEDLLFP